MAENESFSLPKSEFYEDQFRVNFEATFSADVHAIERVVKRIMKAVAQAGCAAGSEFEVELSIREALANAVLHGCKADPSKKVSISVSCSEPRGILIVVRDPGEGFELSQIPSPIVGQNIFSSHGRGIFLINRLMDEVHFKRGGTEIHMIKRG